MEVRTDEGGELPVLPQCEVEMSMMTRDNSSNDSSRRSVYDLIDGRQTWEAGRFEMQ